MIGVYVVYVVAVTLADGANSCLGHVTSSANYSSVLCFHLLIWARVMLLCARVEGGANDHSPENRMLLGVHPERDHSSTLDTDLIVFC